MSTLPVGGGRLKQWHLHLVLCAAFHAFYEQQINSVFIVGFDSQEEIEEKVTILTDKINELVTQVLFVKYTDSQCTALHCTALHYISAV